MLAENGTEKMSRQLWEWIPFLPIKNKRAEKAETSHNLPEHGEADPLGWHCAKQTFWVTGKQLF